MSRRPNSVEEPAQPVFEVSRPRNRFDRLEWAGAFGDLGTLIPFVTAYIAVLKMDPLGILLAFGVSMVISGWFYRTPFPVQPMKAIGAVAATQAAQLSVMTSGAVIAASLLTGLFWLLLGLSGVAARVAKAMPKDVIVGIVLGLGMNFILEGAKMMSTNWLMASAGLLIAVLLRTNKAFPAMFVLLVLGVLYSAIKDATLIEQLGQIEVGFRMPELAVAAISWNDLMLGAIYLMLPQIPLTLGNAIIGTKEENNRLFPDRTVSVRGVSISTGLMNLFGSSIGGVPMCHGAGGMAAHVSFGARTGGSSIILGSILIVLALCFSGSIELLLRAFPASLLGVILFMAGVVLGLGNLPANSSKRQAFVVVATAGMAMWNVAVAFLLGLALFALAKRGYLDS